jgi:hypothetical protein
MDAVLFSPQSQPYSSRVGVRRRGGQRAAWPCAATLRGNRHATAPSGTTGRSRPAVDKSCGAVARSGVRLARRSRRYGRAAPGSVPRGGKKNPAHTTGSQGQPFGMRGSDKPHAPRRNRYSLCGMRSFSGHYAVAAKAMQAGVRTGGRVSVGIRAHAGGGGGSGAGDLALVSGGDGTRDWPRLHAQGKRTICPR